MAKRCNGKPIEVYDLRKQLILAVPATKKGSKKCTKSFSTRLSKS